MTETPLNDDDMTTGAGPGSSSPAGEPGGPGTDADGTDADADGADADATDGDATDTTDGDAS